MNIGKQGKALIEASEGRKYKAYPDPKTGGAPWTIGIGHAGPEVVPGLVWTDAQIDAAFAKDIAKFENIVNDCVHVQLTQGQFDAMVSIIYNVGAGGRLKDGIVFLKSGAPSTLLRKLNAKDYPGAADEFPKWCSPGSEVEHGLTIRREAERKLFLGEV
jgi:lysozyme